MIRTSAGRGGCQLHLVPSLVGVFLARLVTQSAMQAHNFLQLENVLPACAMGHLRANACIHQHNTC
jgi:hypothetical protein